MSAIVTIFWYLVMSYIDSQKNKSYVLYDAIFVLQWGYGIGSARPSRADWRYRPY